MFRSRRQKVKFIQIDSSTIDGYVEFVHSQYLRHKCQQFYVSDKIINNIDYKELIFSEIRAILCSLFSVFTLFYLILENMSTNGRKCCFPCYI